MLLESDVIDAVCLHLESQDYIISQRLRPTQRGDDIVAVKDGIPNRKLIIEAKGETSSRKGSSRYGKQFSSAQVRGHVSSAFYKAAEVLSREPADVEIRVGIALPITTNHQRMIEYIIPTLNQLGILVFWVAENGDVSIEGSLDFN